MMLVLYGPTATGKTALAIHLARKFQGELISADSRQVYEGLDIGTGKVSFGSKVEKHKGYWIVDGIKISGFDLAYPSRRFSVVDFDKFAKVTINKIIKSGKLPIVAGGTGFYIKSLIDGIDSLGVLDNPNLRSKLGRLSASELYQKLIKVDPHRALVMNQSDRANPRRLIRAIEIALHKRKQGTRQRKQLTANFQMPTPNCLIFGLTAPNEYLYARANNWFKVRLAKGMIEEIENLLQSGVDPHWLEDLGLEYRWLTRYLLAKVSYETAVERLKGDIHNFIRRQKTWFKKFKKIELFDISQKNWQSQLEKRAELWYTHGENGKSGADKS